VFLTIGLNPVLQKTLLLKGLHENEVNRSSEYFLDASGKGINTTRVLAHLDEPVVHLTHAGGRNRNLFFNLAKSDGINLHGIDSGSEIRFGYTLLNRLKNTTTEIIEEAAPVETGTQERVLGKYEELLNDVSLVIFSGSKAAGYTDDLIPEMVRLAKTKEKKVVLDVRGADLTGSLDYHPDIIMPNLSEFVCTFMQEDVDFLSEHLEDAETLERVGREMLNLYSKFGSITVLTRGKLSTLYVWENNIGFLEPETLKPINTIGCGDAFTAGFSSAFMKNQEIPLAVEKGHLCARKNAVLLRPGVLR